MKNPKLKTGDILHCSRKGVIAFLIRKFTKSPISHSALVVEVWDEIYILEAQPKGVHAKSYKEWVRKYNYDFIIARPVMKLNKEMLSKRAFSRIGATGYDFVNFFLRHPVAIIRGKWGKKRGDKNINRMICSEYVAWVYAIETAHRITPKDLYQYTQNTEFVHETFVK